MISIAQLFSRCPLHLFIFSMAPSGTLLLRYRVHADHILCFGVDYFYSRTGTEAIVSCILLPPFLELDV